MQHHSKDSFQFEAYYQPLATLIRTYSLQGLDLDIEEPVPLSTATRLISRLRADFGPSFLLTLAPVATALLPDPRLPPSQRPPRPTLSSRPLPNPLHPTLPHLSGFSYPELECSVWGQEVAWYNTQFYCGWGDAGSCQWYDGIISAGWNPSKIVLGVVTNPGNGAGHVGIRKLREVCVQLRAKYAGVGGFGGVMGWEYFNAGEGGEDRREIPGFLGEDGEGRVTECCRASWVAALGQVLRTPEVPTGESRLGGFTAEQIRQMVARLPEPRTPWPDESVNMLVQIGFEKHEAIAALNATEGDVERAAELLFN